VKSPAFVNTPRYSEVSLAGARGFFLSLLERFFHVKSVSPCCVFRFRSSLSSCRDCNKWYQSPRF
jgi:hypothetical protein